MNSEEIFKDIINKINFYIENFINNTYKPQYESIKQLNQIYNLTNQYILRKGKRLRPLLFTLTASMYKYDTPFNIDEDIIKDSIFLELLQAFFLCHDDIIDDSELRRGDKSLHVLLDEIIEERIKESCNKSKYYDGKMFSIISGDYIFSIACKAVHQIRFSDEYIRNKFIETYYNYVQDTIAGQNIDMLHSHQKIEDVDTEIIKKVYKLKTAKYTIECPMILGAIYSGIQNDNEYQKLKNYATNLGIAFQIQDDIIGVFGDEKNTGKSIKSDILEEKKTLLIKYTLESLNEKDRKVFKDIYYKRPISDSNFNTIKKIFRESGALSKCNKEIEYLLNKSIIIIDDLNLSKECKLLLKNFTFKIMSKYKNLN